MAHITGLSSSENSVPAMNRMNARYLAGPADRIAASGCRVWASAVCAKPCSHRLRWFLASAAVSGASS